MLHHGRRPFVRNVATVATGTAASQAIAMGFAPVITRLYGPETLGLMGIFMSVVGLLMPIAALGYPIAIVLPEFDADALNLARLSIYIGTVATLLTVVVLFFFGADLLSLLDAEEIVPFVYLLPVFMFFSVLAGVLGQWLIRKRAFVLTAKYVVFTTLLLNSSKTILGFLHPTAMVLIVTNTFGSLFGTSLTFWGWRKYAARRRAAQATRPSSTLQQLAGQYRDFPLLRTPQNLINAFSQSLPVLFLASFFGASAAGQYSIAITVLAMPSSLIGGSIMAVFYPRINEALQNGEDARALIIKATLGMAVTGALPFLVVIVAGPFLFEFVFGDQWQTAGTYAQWLSLWLFLQYVNKPAVSAIPALHLQGGLLAYELFSTGTKILALWLGFTIFGNDIAAIALFSLFGVIAYAWLIFWVIQNSGKRSYHE
ncbi:MAG TPA: lipopolysaccharide biosynthesis protein [Gammaproteobacteria bacterium]|nr:lipopolysaccharide biosynthesis protein [Gammaproteobacteria bacterium]